MCKIFKKIEDNKEGDKIPLDESMGLGREKEILKTGKEFIRTFRNIAFGNGFKDVIEDYELSTVVGSFRSSLIHRYLFEYKNMKFRVEINEYYPTRTYYLNLFQIDSDDNELSVFEIQHWKKDRVGDSKYEYYCVDEEFENFLVNVMISIMDELRKRDKDYIEYFKSLIPAEDLK